VPQSRGAVISGFLKKHWRKLVLVAVSAPLLGYLGLCLVIGSGVLQAVSAAQSRFPGDPVTALASVVTSEDTSLSERNRSIWALGQLGSPKALPVLQSLVRDELCDHESKICQYELEKAIEGCSGSPNIGAVIWRQGKLASR
jgi:hypothetical protein